MTTAHPSVSVETMKFSVNASGGNTGTLQAIDNSILTLLLLVPIAGAVLVLLVPDRARLPNWIALLVSLVTFGLALHLPAHFAVGRGGFQFDQI